jgi:hypothetical protein
MILTKLELISSLQNEVRLLLHLCGKVRPEMLDYRPTTKQRSLIDDLRGEIEIFGLKLTRGRMLVDLALCGYSAYRMQLFCYLKACGREELNTMNLWMGIDASM